MMTSTVLGCRVMETIHFEMPGRLDTATMPAQRPSRET